MISLEIIKVSSIHPLGMDVGTTFLWEFIQTCIINRALPVAWWRIKTPSFTSFPAGCIFKFSRPHRYAQSAQNNNRIVGGLLVACKVHCMGSMAAYGRPEQCLAESVKHWFGPGRTSYHFKQTADVCEITKTEERLKMQPDAG